MFMITADKKLKKMARNDCVKNENMKDQKPKKEIRCNEVTCITFNYHQIIGKKYEKKERASSYKEKEKNISAEKYKIKVI